MLFFFRREASTPLEAAHNQKNKSPESKVKFKFFLLSTIVALSFIFRFLFLSYPHQIVFDESYYMSQSVSYACSGEGFMDPHPPIAKLPSALMIKLYGCEFVKNHYSLNDMYPKGLSWLVRLYPAFMGALVPIMVMIILLLWRIDLGLVAVAGLALVFENALIVQSRIFTLESSLLAATIAVVLFSIIARNLMAQGNQKRVIYLWVVLAGIASGIAVGSKLSGLVAPFLSALILLSSSHASLSKKIRLTLFMLSICSVIYISAWYLHWYLLYSPSAGEFINPISYAWDMSLMSIKLASSPKGHHPFASPWWGWPIFIKPVSFWVSPLKNSYILLVSNLFIWRLAFVFFLLAFADQMTSLFYNFKSNFNLKVWIPWCGWFVAYFPYTLLARTSYIWYYNTSFIFSVIIIAVWKNQRLPDDIKKRRTIYLAATSIIIIGFLSIAPVTYGLESPDWYFRSVTTAFPGFAKYESP